MVSKKVWDGTKRGPTNTYKGSFQVPNTNQRVKPTLAPFHYSYTCYYY